MHDFIIVGAGISGLTAAHKLAQAGKDIIVLESSNNAGGKIATERVDGYLLESGPNSLRVENQETVDLIEECGLSSRVIEASPNSKKRFILKDGHWVKIPSNSGEAISTSLFSFRGKLRTFAEPFIPKTKLDDESAALFISRRLGKEIFEYAADPFITGIYAGDPHKLSMRFAFPQIWQVEQEHGSLLRGMMKGRKSQTGKKNKSRVVSFPEGLSELTDTIKSNLAEQIQFHKRALQIEQCQNGFAITTSTGTLEARQIIFALPAYDIVQMMNYIAPELSKSLIDIDYPPVAIAYLGYQKNQFATTPEGFGGLIPSNGNKNILGVIFSSSIFPNRAPKDHLLLTVLMGGTRKPEILEWSNEKVIETATAEINDLLEPRGAPVFQHVRLWKRAIPQYNLGYGLALDAIQQAEQENPGLYFIGNYRGGISVGACIKNATELAKRLV